MRGACGIVGIERHGAPQQAFPFPGIGAEEARQLDEHLSLRGQCRRIVGASATAVSISVCMRPSSPKNCKEPLGNDSGLPGRWLGSARTTERGELVIRRRRGESRAGPCAWPPKLRARGAQNSA